MISDDAAVFIEPLAAAWEIVEQVPLQPGTRTLVLGDGRLGQLCAMVLAHNGSPPTVLGKHEKKLARLANLGLPTGFDPAGFQREFDLVVDATGSPDGLSQALKLVRPRGTIVLKSTYHGAAPLDLTGVVIDEVSVIGSRCGPFSPAIAQLARTPSMLDDMVTARFPLARIDAAFETAQRSDSLKVLVDI